MSLKYEPASEPLHISVEWLFLTLNAHKVLFESADGKTALECEAKCTANSVTPKPQMYG